MKLSPLKVFAGIAIVTGMLASNSIAQEQWGAGQPSSCSQRGGCSRGYDSIGMMPYGIGNRVDGCGYGGSCNRAAYAAPYDHGYSAESCSGGVCPFEKRRQLAVHGNRNGYESGQAPFGQDGLGYDPRSQFGVEPSYSSPAPQRSEDYRNSPADLPPRLSSPPSFSPSSNYAANSTPPQPGDFGLPPQSSQQRTSPPFLPPSSSSRQLGATDSHAGHDHAGHNH